MQYLRKTRHEEARQVLRKAESSLFSVNEIVTRMPELTETLINLRNQLLGLTYNNLGCVEKQAFNLEAALKYSKLALEFESLGEEKQDFVAISNSAGTILNICAILSKLNRHKEAHSYAL